MTTELQTKLERIKELCRKHTGPDAVYAMHSHAISPVTAKALLVAIEALEEGESCHAQSYDTIVNALGQICQEWPE